MCVCEGGMWGGHPDPGLSKSYMNISLAGCLGLFCTVVSIVSVSSQNGTIALRNAHVSSVHLSLSVPHIVTDVRWSEVVDWFFFLRGWCSCIMRTELGGGGLFI